VTFSLHVDIVTDLCEVLEQDANLLSHVGNVVNIASLWFWLCNLTFKDLILLKLSIYLGLVRLLSHLLFKWIHWDLLALKLLFKVHFVAFLLLTHKVVKV
jgi:hypothetical protein